MEQTIGQRIAMLRQEHNLTQAELAEKLNISDKAISKWESAGGTPDITLLPLLSDILEVSIDYIVRGKSFKEQRIFAGVPYAPINKINGLKMLDGLNAHYLSRGWHVTIANSVPSSDTANEVIIVIERDK